MLRQPQVTRLRLPFVLHAVAKRSRTKQTCSPKRVWVVLGMKTNHLPDLLKLSVAERIQLVEDIWDSIAAEPYAVQLSDELRDELDRRLDEQAANPGVGRPWSEVKAQLLRGECSRERYEAALAEVPDVEPEEYDRR
jgi:putative addiction module component (TIGR02574 family)